MYAIREVHSGDWWSDRWGWMPASNQATLFESRLKAEGRARENGLLRTVVVIEFDDDPEKGLPPLP
jgi:hypothetical protein